MTRRYEYCLDLSDFKQHSPSVPVARFQLRSAQPKDTNALAKLMIEAYRGTIDYDDETIDDAVREVKAYLAGKRGGRPLLDESRLAYIGPQLVGACLACYWQERRQPIVAYVMTHGTWKNQGVGRQMLSGVMQALHEQGYRQLRAVITEGNTPSESLFGGLGFRKVKIK